MKMKKPKVDLWVFFPTLAEQAIEWVKPPNYITPEVGTMRVRLETDTPYDDHSFFQPGWHRAKDLEELYEIS